MTIHSNDQADEDSLHRAVPDRSAAVQRLTGILAGIIVTGVLLQAVLAGGFLAGRPALRDLHEHLGYGLLVVAVLLFGLGLIARRFQAPATASLPSRGALVLTLAATVFAGMRASRGDADLLMLHIPLAFVIMVLATRLLIIASPVANRGLGRAGRGRSAPQGRSEG